jgi:hypothetical protein
VLGSQLPNLPETGTLQPSVEGTQESTNPPASIPRTGRNLGDWILVAGVALLVGGLALRYGDDDRTAAAVARR